MRIAIATCHRCQSTFRESEYILHMIYIHIVDIVMKKSVKSTSMIGRIASRAAFTTQAVPSSPPPYIVYFDGGSRGNPGRKHTSSSSNASRNGFRVPRGQPGLRYTQDAPKGGYRGANRSGKGRGGWFSHGTRGRDNEFPLGTGRFELVPRESGRRGRW